MINASVTPSVARRAAVAGLFYPADRATLSHDIAEFLEQTRESDPSPGFPKALIVPHAGYIYSGPVAAEAYDLLRGARGIVSRVVLLGPCHRVPVRGLALPGARAFETPLGRIAIDEAAVQAIRSLPQVVESAAAHALEHALEVQLPFLQQVLGDFQLVPLVVGVASAEQVAEVLDRLWGGAETLIVISSDLSHYHAYEEACSRDAGTVRAILAGETGLDHEQACGATPVSGLLLAAAEHGLAARLLDCRNSGDTAGGRDRVVGYASFAFLDAASEYGDEHGAALLALARGCIGAALGLHAAPTVPEKAWLRECRASFVSIKLDGALRGCIGRLEAERPLGKDVLENARAAAFSDPRFGPLTAGEFRRCILEVSLLSAPKVVAFADHADLIRQLEPGRDGLILECRDRGAVRRGTFLPQVWESLPEPEQFIAHLKSKAGLPETTRTERCRVMRYRALKWSEAMA